MDSGHVLFLVWFLSLGFEFAGPSVGLLHVAEMTPTHHSSRVLHHVIILDTLNLPRAISQLHVSKTEREEHGNVTEYP